MEFIDIAIAWFTAFPLVKRNLVLAMIATVLFTLSYLFSLWYFPRKDL